MYQIFIWSSARSHQHPPPRSQYLSRPLILPKLAVLPRSATAVAMGGSAQASRSGPLALGLLRSHDLHLTMYYDSSRTIFPKQDSSSIRSVTLPTTLSSSKTSSSSKKKSSSSLGSDENPIQLVQKGSSFHTSQQLSNSQLTQVMVYVL